MHRPASLLVLTVLLMCGGRAGWGQTPEATGQAPGARARQDRLDTDLRDLEARLGTDRLVADQAISDSERLRSRYLSMRPLAPRFGADEFRRQGRLAQRSFAWLDGARRRFRGNPLVTRSLLGTYAALGDFYGRGGLGSRLGFWFGYAGAHRVGRSLVLAGQEGPAFDRTLEALALTWATVAAADWSRNRWFWPEWDAAGPGYERFIDQAVGREHVPEPVALPSVDDSSLSTQDRLGWREVRDKFPSVSARAHEAQLALADLRRRLAMRGLELHPRSVAASLAMQGYLQDAVDAIDAHAFDRALEALTRADYERDKLRHATGQ